MFLFLNSFHSRRQESSKLVLLAFFLSETSTLVESRDPQQVAEMLSKVAGAVERRLLIKFGYRHL
jgi:hypothetical protein